MGRELELNFEHCVIHLHMRKGVWVAWKRRTRMNKGTRRDKCSLRKRACWKPSGSWGSQRAETWPVLTNLPIRLLLSVTFTVVISRGQLCMFTQILCIFNRIKKWQACPLSETLRECLSLFTVGLKLGTSSHSPVRLRNAIDGQWLSICSGVGPGCGQQKGARPPCATVTFSRLEEAGFLKALPSKGH